MFYAITNIVESGVEHHNPISNLQTIQWPKEKGQGDKQNTTQKTKD
jgi:hypothetical protein